MKIRKVRPKAAGYSDAGASRQRRALKGFTAQSFSPRQDIDDASLTLRQRARMLYMAAPLATSAINTNRTKVVGVGLTLKAAINRDVLGLSEDAARQWERRAEAEFRLWAGKKQNCDALGMNNFAALQQLAIKSWLMSGDVFALLKHEKPAPQNPYGLRIQLIEADRVCTPAFCGGGHLASGISEGTVPDGHPGAGRSVYDGVEVDKSGRAAAFYIASDYPFGRIHKNITWTRVPVWGNATGMPNILQVMDAERPDQYRGVPYLSQVIEPLLQLRRYTESELMGALIQSFFTAWVYTETNPADIPFNEVGQGDVDGIAGNGSTDEALGGEISDSQNEYEMGPGTVLHLQDGEKVNFGSPQIPTAGFEAFTRTLARLIGSALEMPYDVIVKEFNSSYSASRGALLEAWEAFRMRRAWFVDDFCQPIYEVWLSEAVARGRLKAPGFFDDPLVRAAYCGARWIGPVQGQLDPLKEAKAAILMTNHAIKTHEQVTREMGGGDWNENAVSLKLENELLSEAGASGQGDAAVSSMPNEEGEGE